MSALRAGLLSAAAAMVVASFMIAGCASTHSEIPAGMTTGSFGRVIAVEGKRVVPCPVQDDRTAVLLVFGQSNSANHAERSHQSAHGASVVNLFEGTCYEASSPLLGADGTLGESWTLLGNRLVEARLFSTVIIVSTGIGGTKIERWQAGGDLNRMLMEAVDGAQRRYSFTHLLWHQGESDAGERTSAADYTRSFQSLGQSLRQRGVTAPIFVSVASRCDVQDWKTDHPIAQAQRAMVDPGRGIFAGVDTDQLIPEAQRRDGCHFASTGQETFAAAWLGILKQRAIGQHSPNEP